MSSPVCPLCGSSSTRAIAGTVEPRAYFSGSTHAYAIAGGSAVRFDVLRCTGCGHGWTPLAADIDVLGWYAKAPADATYLAEAHGRRMAAAGVLRHLERFHAPATLLDIGAGPGLLVGEAKGMGWDARGLEPAAWAVAESKTRGLGDVMQQGDTSALAAMPAQSMDALTAIDIVEHLPDPQKFLNDCARLLRSGGVMAVVTPRYDSVLSKLLGTQWYCVIPAHLHYFTKRSLCDVLRKAGLEPVSVRHHVRRFSVGYLLARLLRRPYRENSLSWTIPVPLFDTLEIVARKA